MNFHPTFQGFFYLFLTHEMAILSKGIYGHITLLIFFLYVRQTWMIRLILKISLYGVIFL